jgi:putative lipoprotein
MGLMLSGFEEFVVFGFMPLMLGILAVRGRADPDVSTVVGKVVISQSARLPETAFVTVELVEQRRGETIVPALARETALWRGGGGQRFALHFDRSAIDPMAFYALRARIVDGSTVLFETPHAELTALSGGQQTLMLMPAS